jgi:phospholipid/cholesterol/gamma-HCH transport system substrate-binding protein
MTMNERVMQFRLGMFVIVAGLVLTMMIVWFGESPSLFRDRVFLTVHFPEAPGVSEGIAVRKSGIRIGEVAEIRFDTRRTRRDDGVLVTLAIDRRKVELRAGSRPKLSRALIGDVSIEMLPGQGPGPLTTRTTPGLPPDGEIVEGIVAPDPSRALAEATGVMQDVQGTLKSIRLAADNFGTLSQKAGNIDEFLTSWIEMGKSVKTLAGDFDRVVKDNEANLKPAIANLRDVSEKLNTALGPEAQKDLQATIRRFNSSSARLDQALADFAPLARDLGAKPGTPPATEFGQVIKRLNVITYEVGLLTRTFSDGRGGLNPNGTLQKLLLQAEAYDNLNQAAIAVRDVFNRLRPAAAALNVFAEKVAKEPSLLTRGALQR